MAVSKPISDVLRELEARYDGNTALNTIIQVTGLADLSAVGQVSKLRQAIITLKTAEAETESLPCNGAGDFDLDQPLDSAVLSELADSCFERDKFIPSSFG